MPMALCNGQRTIATQVTQPGAEKVLGLEQELMNFERKNSFCFRQSLDSRVNKHQHRSVSVTLTNDFLSYRKDLWEEQFRTDRICN